MTTTNLCFACNHRGDSNTVGSITTDKLRHFNICGMCLIRLLNEARNIQREGGQPTTLVDNVS